MTHILVVLPAYRQLKKLVPDLIASCEAEMQATLGVCCDELSVGPGSYFYVAGETVRQMRAMAGAVCRLAGWLDQRRDGLQGYSVAVLDSARRSAESAFARSNRFLLTAPVDDGVWTDASSRETLSRVFECETTEGAVRIVGAKVFPSIGADVRDMIVVDPAVSDDLHELITDFHTRAHYEAVCLVHGGDRVRRRRTVESVLECVSGGVHDGTWLRTDAVCGAADGGAAIVATIRSAHARYGRAHVTRWREKTWRRLERRLLGGGAPHIDTGDMVNGLAVAIARYLECARDMVVPPVWVVHEYEALDAVSKSVVLRMLQDKGGGDGLLAIITSSKPIDIGASGRCVRVSECRRHAELADEPVAGVVVPSGYDAIEAYHYLHAKLFGAASFGGSPDADPLSITAAGLPDSTRLLLVVLDTAAPILSLDQIGVFMRERNIFERQFRYDCEHLSDLGFIELSEGVRVNPDLIERVESTPAPGERDALRSDLAEFCRFLRAEGAIGDTRSLARLLAFRSLENAAPVYRSIIRRAADAGDVNTLREIMAELDGLGAGAGDLKRVAGLRLDALERRGRSDEAASVALPGDGLSESVSAEPACAAAEYLRVHGAYRDSLGWAKRAVMSAHGKDAVVEARANLEIAFNMLSLGRVGEAQAYFEHAADQSEGNEDPFGTVKAVLGLAATLFLSGNLSRSVGALEKALETGTRCGADAELVLGDYLRARLEFELGAYDDAVARCLDGLTRCTLYRLASPRQTLFGLLARSMVYGKQVAGFHRRERALAEIPEGAIPVAEQRYFSGRYDEALEALEASRPAGSPSRTWSGLFGPAEGAAGIDVVSRLVPAFSAMLSRTANRRVAETRASVSEMIREERLDPHDIHNGVYCFYYAMSLSSSSSGTTLDYMTALGRAAKYVQERAAKIDDASMRRRYLRDNYWNRRILDQARANNLV